MRRLILLSAVVVVVFGYGVSLAWAETIQVPDDYGTIQEAINAAVSSDTIIVADGTYIGSDNKNLDFGGKSIILKSAGGAANCIINCESSGRGFYFHSGETSDAIVDGFTITNGNGNNYSGGAIYLVNGTPTIKNCIMTGNSTNYAGGGVAIAGSASPLFINCEITDNTAYSFGGGVYCYATNATPTFINCTIADNHGAFGGGIFNAWSNPTLDNCIVWGNTDNIHIADQIRNQAGTFTLNNCCYADGWGNVYGTVIANNCINLDPLFVGVGDYHLQEASPCIDAGDNALVPADLTTDLDGNPRIAGAAVDMGPYELQLGLTYVSETVKPNNVRPGSIKVFYATVRNNTAQAVILTTETVFRFDDSSEGGAHLFETNLLYEVTIPSGEAVELTFAEAEIDAEFAFGSYFPVIEATDGVDFYEIPVTDTVTIVPDLLIVSALPPYENSPYKVRGDCDFLDIWVQESGNMVFSGSKVRVTARDVTNDDDFGVEPGTELWLLGLGDMTISDSGKVNLKGKGYEAGKGPIFNGDDKGAGTDGEAFRCGGGGGASNACFGHNAPDATPGVGVRGNIYPDHNTPENRMGSGGGLVQAEFSSEGGGSINIRIIGGTLTNDGIIDVSGNDGHAIPEIECGTGGGGAGTMFISAYTLSGDGVFRALGGKGGGVEGVIVPHPGGAGGDGHIAIFCGKDNFTGSLDVGEGIGFIVSMTRPHGSPGTPQPDDALYNDPTSDAANIGNELTYSTGAFPMVSTLSVPCEATVVPAHMAPIIEPKLRWTIWYDLGEAEVTWTPHAVGDEQKGAGKDPTATLTTTVAGLPTSNNAFGPKVIVLEVEGYEMAGHSSATIELFYPKNGFNHPSTAGNADWPNWMYYWLPAVEPLGTPPPTFKYGAETGFPAGTTEITLSAGDATEYDAPYGTHNPLGGIDNFTWTVRHESQHYKDWCDLWNNDYTDWLNNHRGGSGPDNDKDGDRIPNRVEDVNLNGTYDVGIDLYDWERLLTTYPGQDAAILNDFEEWDCQRNKDVTGNHELDWSNPGMQHKTNGKYDD